MQKRDVAIFTSMRSNKKEYNALCQEQEEMLREEVLVVGQPTELSETYT